MKDVGTLVIGGWNSTFGGPQKLVQIITPCKNWKNLTTSSSLTLDPLNLGAYLTTSLVVNQKLFVVGGSLAADCSEPECVSKSVRVLDLSGVTDLQESQMRKWTVLLELEEGVTSGVLQSWRGYLILIPGNLNMVQKISLKSLRHSIG